MWDRKKYDSMLNKIAEVHHLKGHRVKNKEAAYRLIGELLHVSYSAVKSWNRQNNNGPGDQELLEELEELLGTKLTTETTMVEKEKGKMTVRYSEFVKGNIMKCYDLIMEYLHSDEIESEEVFCKMRANVHKLKVGIPKDIFDKIEDCVDTHVEPMIYDEAFWAELYTEDIGYYDDENTFHLLSEEAIYKQAGLFYSKIFEVERKVEEFAMEELYPILVS